MRNFKYLTKYRNRDKAFYYCNICVIFCVCGCWFLLFINRNNGMLGLYCRLPIISYIYGHYVTGLQFMNNLNRINNPLNMLTVLSWCGQLRTNEEAYLGVDQPIGDRHVKISGFGRKPCALWDPIISEILWTECYDCMIGELKHTPW